MTVQLHLPYPPSANRLWARTKTGMRKSDEYRTWLNDAGWHAKAQKPGKIEGPYALRLLATKPDKRKRDLDNILKSTSDLLQSIGVIQNDSDCVKLTAEWIEFGDGLTVYVDRADP